MFTIHDPHTVQDKYEHPGCPHILGDVFLSFFRMISCGRDNIRLWRVKDGALRSAPVNLGEYHASFEFTDCCFEAGFEPTKDPLDRLV